MNNFIAKFSYLYRNTRPGKYDCDYKVQLSADSKLSAAEQAQKIAQSQKKPMYLISVEPINEKKQNYGDCNCFRYVNGCEITIRQLTDSKEAKIILKLEPPYNEPLSIILNSEAKQQLIKWLQINRKVSGKKPIFNRAKSPNLKGAEPRKDGVA